MIKNQSITLTRIVVQGKGNIVSDMGGEKVMLSVGNGKYYNLGVIGGRIWDLMEVATTVARLVKELITEYDVGQIECEYQVISFLQGLLDEGLIDIGQEASA